MWAGHEEGSPILGGWEQSWLPHSGMCRVSLARPQSTWEDTNQSQSHGNATQTWLYAQEPQRSPGHSLLNYTG